MTFRIFSMGNRRRKSTDNCKLNRIGFNVLSYVQKVWDMLAIYWWVYFKRIHLYWKWLNSIRCFVLHHVPLLEILQIFTLFLMFSSNLQTMLIHATSRLYYKVLQFELNWSGLETHGCPRSDRDITTEHLEPF